jgi:hypothetical protein
MGSSNRKAGDREKQHFVIPSRDHGAPGSDFDRERETTPAPASTSGEWSSLDSDRPTSVPEYDVVAHAFESGLVPQGAARLPLDLAIPVRTALAPPEDLELHAAFVLLHVDGRSSVHGIAELVMAPVDNVLATLIGLTTLGRGTLGGTPAVTAKTPTSGERPKGAAGRDAESEDECGDVEQ